MCCVYYSAHTISGSYSRVRDIISGHGRFYFFKKYICFFTLNKKACQMEVKRNNWYRFWNKSLPLSVRKLTSTLMYYKLIEPLFLSEIYFCFWRKNKQNNYTYCVWSSTYSIFISCLFNWYHIILNWRRIGRQPWVTRTVPI